MDICFCPTRNWNTMYLLLEPIFQGDFNCRASLKSPICITLNFMWLFWPKIEYLQDNMAWIAWEVETNATISQNAALTLVSSTSYGFKLTRFVERSASIASAYQRIFMRPEWRTIAWTIFVKVSPTRRKLAIEERPLKGNVLVHRRAEIFGNVVKGLR